MTEAVRTEGGGSRLSAIWSALERSGGAAAQRRLARGAHRGGAAVVDNGRRHRRGAVVDRAGADHRAGALLRSLKRPVSALPIVFFALVVLALLWSDAPWHDQSHQLGQAEQAADAAAPDLSFRALVARRVGFRRVPGVLPAAGGRPASSRWIRRCPLKQLFSRAAVHADQRHRRARTTSTRARNFRCARWRWPIRSVTSLREGRTRPGVAACGDRAGAGRQHVVRRDVAHGAGDDADHARGIPAAASAMAGRASRRFARLALLAGVRMVDVAAVAQTVDKFFIDYRYQVQNNETGMGSRLIYWRKSLRSLPTRRSSATARDRRAGCSRRLRGGGSRRAGHGGQQSAQPDAERRDPVGRGRRVLL